MIRDEKKVQFQYLCPLKKFGIDHNFESITLLSPQKVSIESKKKSYFIYQLNTGRYPTDPPKKGGFN